MPGVASVPSSNSAAGMVRALSSYGSLRSAVVWSAVFVAGLGQRSRVPTMGWLVGLSVPELGACLWPG